MHLLRDLALSLSFDRVQESEINRSRPTLNSALMHCRVFFSLQDAFPDVRMVAGVSLVPRVNAPPSFTALSVNDFLSVTSLAAHEPGHERRLGRLEG